MQHQLSLTASHPELSILLVQTKPGGMSSLPRVPAHWAETPARYSAFIPSSLMIGHHFWASAFCKAASASGVCRSRGKTS
jgi:hypothetical protein